MTKTIKANNPDYKPIVVGWRVKMAPLQGKGISVGDVEYFIRSPEGRDERIKRQISFRCAAGPERLCITSLGKASETRKGEGGEAETRSVSLILTELPKEALNFLIAVRRSVEREWRKLANGGEVPAELAGVLSSWPHERGIKWLREYELVSLDALEIEPLVESPMP